MSSRSRTSNFNPRARVGRDRTKFPAACPAVISIHAPAWGATEAVLRTPWSGKFQSTRPRGARRRTGGVLFVCVHFNPRARVGRDAQSGHQQASIRISIHAPAWGATKLRTKATGARTISIHAPAWGATELAFIDNDEDAISIHAPAWGATAMEKTLRRIIEISIHAPAWGATSLPSRSFCHALFQSTRPRGARHDDEVKIFWRDNFNPRARVGRDHPRTIKMHERLISIHAPAWGATGRAVWRAACGRISIHAPAWGATKARRSSALSL